MGAEKLSKEKEEIVPEAGTRRDDQDGDKGDLRLERLDPDTGDGGVELDAKHEVVGDESPVVMVSTEDVPNVEASRVEDKHYTGEGESPAEVASTDVVAEENVVSAGGEGLDATLGARVTAAGDALEATASAPGDAALETVEIPVYQEKGSDDGAEKLPKEKEEIVPEATEYGTKPDDQDGDKSDARPERLDPDTGDGGVELDAKHEVVGDESPVVMVSTEDVPNVEASRVDDKHYTGEGESLAEVASTDVVAEENVVSAGGEGLDATLGARVAAAGDALEAAASAPGDAALETVDVPVYQEKGTDDGAEKLPKEKEEIVPEAGTRRDDQEKDGNTATELPREVVPEATEYGTKPDDQDGDKSDARPERLDPDTGDGGVELDAKHEVGDESPVVMVSTEDVPNVEASRVDDKHYTGEGESLAEVASTDVVAEENVVSAGGEGLDATLGARVTAAGDALEATALAPGDAALETVEIPVDKEGDKRDPDEVKAGKKKEEREEIGLIVPNIDQKAELEGYKSEEAPAISGIKQDAVVDSRIIEESRVDDKHYTGEGESLAEVASTDVVAEENVVSAGGEGLDATLGARVAAAGDALEAAASAPGDAALETVEIPVYQEKGSDDADVKGFSREDGRISEVTELDVQRDDQEKGSGDADVKGFSREDGGLSEVTEPDAQRDDQEKDGNTATELPREVVPEATEYGTKPDDQDGDKSDARPERLDPDTGDGGVELDAKHEVGDESPVVMVSTEDVPNVEASRVDDKHYTGEGESLAEVASTDVVAEENVVSAGGEGLDATLGARVAAAGDALEAAASAPGDAALEAVDVPVYQEKGSDDGAEKLPKEKEEIVPEAGTRRDDQEKDGNTATELPREVVPEATEYGTKPDDPEGDKRDSGSEKSGSDSGDAESENETKERYFWDERYGEVLFADYGKVEDGGLSEVTEPDAQRDDQEGDKSDARTERLDPDTGDGSAIEDEVEVRFSRSSESTDSVPSDYAAGVDKHYSADDESPEGMAATETEAKAVVTAGDALEAAASAPGDAALETLDVPVYQEKDSGDADVKDLSREDGRISEVTELDVQRDDQEKGSGDADVKDLSREDGRISEVTELDAQRDDQEKGSGDADVKGFSREDGRISEVTEPDVQRDDQEKDGNTATELPREVVPEATEYGTKPDDPEGDKRDSGSEKSGSDSGDAESENETKERYFWDERYGEVLFADYGKVEDGGLSEVTELDVQRDDQEKGSGDADVKGFFREDGRISEVTEPDVQRDDQEKDGNTATELPREVVPEATEYGTKPDDQDGDKSDARPERLDPNTGDGGVELDAKHEVGDESPVVMVSTEDVPNVEASRVDDKHYTGEGVSPAEVASTDVVAEENVVSAGDEGLDSTLGARVAAAGDALEATASAPGDAALETVEIPVYQEKGSDDGAEKLPKEKEEIVPEAGTRRDDQDGDKGDLRLERLDPDTGDGGVELDAKHEVVGDESPVVMVSTEDVPNVEASRVEDKHYTGEGESPAEVASTDVVAEENVVSAGGEGLDATLGARVAAAGDALEAAASAPGDAALETVDVPVYQEKGSDDGAEKLPKEKEEIVPEATEYGTKPDDQDGDKSDARPERLDPDIRGGSAEVDAKHEVVGDESPVVMVSTEDVPNVEASRVEDKHYTGEGESPAEVASTDVVAEENVVSAGGEGLDATLGARVAAAGDALEATALAPGDAALETVDVPVYQEKGSDDGAEKLPKEKEEIVPEAGTRRDDQDGDKSDSGSEKSGSDSGDAESENETKERYFWDERYGEVLFADYGKVEDGGLSEVTEPDAQRDDQDGDKGDLRLERLDPDTGDGGVELDAKHEVVGDESPVVMVSTEDVPNVEASRVEDKHYTGEGESPAEVASTDVVAEENVVSAGDEGLDGTLGLGATAAGDALEATASAPGDAALETLDVPVYQEKGSDDGAEKLPKEKEEIVPEAGTRRDDQEKDGNTATELPREVVPEATEYGTKPDDQDGDKSDARPERLDPDTGDGGVELDAKHEVGDESPVVMVSTEDVPNVEASRVDDKHYTGEGESLAEVASTDVVAEENVVSAGGEGLDATLGARVTAAGDALEATALAPGDAALETVDVPVYQEKGSGDADVKDLSREDGRISEVTELDAQRDDQEKDGNTATELPREVVPEATEYGTKPDDQDGDKSDARPERLDPDIRGGSAEVDAKHEVGDESPVVMLSTEDVPNVEASRVDDKHYTGEGVSPAEVASTDVVAEENVVSAGDEGLVSTLGARVAAAGDALEAAASAPGDAALETLDVPVYQEKGSGDADVKGFSREDGRISEVTELDVQRDDQEKGSGDADVKGFSREDGRISEVTEPDVQRDDQEKDGNTATELPREVVPEATEYGAKPDDSDGDKSDLRPETLDPDIRDGSAVEDEVEVRSSKKTLLMRRGQIDVSVVSTATKDIASEALKSGKEEDVVRDTSSKVAAPIEDRGLLKTESDVTTAAQKQSDTDTLELFSGTSSDKKKAKKGDAGKSKKRKPKRKEGQPSGVSTHEILKGLLSTMTSENISHQDKSLPEKDQEQDASKETHQDEKKKSQEKEREEKAQKQKSSISKMQRKISKLRSRIAQGNLTEDEIQVLKNKIAEIEADINGLDS
ncbi:putative sodium/potassium/calcium exchanger [Anaplasma phagocytophilum]|nr:hypothetical protein [Anaplasma phagocytophilum]